MYAPYLTRAEGAICHDLDEIVSDGGHAITELILVEPVFDWLFDNFAFRFLHGRSFRGHFHNAGKDLVVR
jgi:hypothetical protein